MSALHRWVMNTTDLAASDDTHCPTICAGWKSGHGFTGFPVRSRSKLSQSWVPVQGSAGVGSASKFMGQPSVVCRPLDGRPQAAECQGEASLSCLPQGSPHNGGSLYGTPLLQSPQVRQCPGKMGVTILCNPIMDA